MYDYDIHVFHSVVAISSCCYMLCLQLKQSAVRSDRKHSSVQKSPSTKLSASVPNTKLSASSVLSVDPADMLRVRRPLLQDDGEGDVLEAGDMAHSVIDQQMTSEVPAAAAVSSSQSASAMATATAAPAAGIFN